MSKKVVIINGAKRAGKDSFIEACRKLDEKVVSISSIDQIKNIACRYFGWDGVKDEKGRKLLSDLKDASSLYNEGPTNHIIDLVEFSNKHDTIFVQVREPSEIIKLRGRLEHLGIFATTLIIRNEKTEQAANSNHADENVLKFPYRYEFENNGSLADLEKGAKGFLTILESLN